MEEWRYQPARDLALKGEERRKSLLREVGLESAVSCFLWRCLTRSYLFLGHRLQILGHENLPKRGSFVLIANHSSHLDAIVLAAALPSRYVGRVFPIAAGDTFFTKPATSLFATACMNALPIWRKNCGAHALDDLRERLVRDECTYILFPEGTRTRTGKMAAFKAGLGRLVAGTEVPVVPCYIDGAWAALPPERNWPRPKKIRMRIGAPLVFEKASLDREGWESIRVATEGAVRALAT
jgi:1-acyl-sn-glycerol-3-phosphate acyltransferase